jgi:hypothetical protein
MIRMTRAIAAALLLSACGAPVPDAAEDVSAADTSGPDTARPGQTPLQDRPAERADTVMIEGMPEVSSSQLVTSTLEHGVPFSTYKPEGLQTLYDRDGAAAGLRFAAAFSGDAEPEAFMHVRFYGPGKRPAPAEVANLLPLPWQDQAAPAPGACQPVDPPSWAEAACAFDYTAPGGQHRVGRVLVARRGDHAFHVLTHYPAEFGDGLGPRFQRILDEWRWEDTGDLLVSGPHTDD